MLSKDLIRQSSNLIFAFSLLLTSISPSILLSSKVKAAQITERSITLSDSTVGAELKTATVSFKNATTGIVQGIVFDFCTTALIGTTCIKPAGFGSAVGWPGVTTIDGLTFDGYYFGSSMLLANDTGASASAGETYTFNIRITNPTNPGTYYARLLTYSSKTEALSYIDTDPGAYADYGTVALSATNDLTTTGIVTEILTFCVGATDNTPDASDPDIQTCGSSGFSGAKTVGLGVIGSSPVSTPVSIENGGTNTHGAFLVKSNAIGGVAISYAANQNNSSGKLKIPGATCSGSSTVDGCINSAGTTGTTLSGEGFGMAISELIYPDSIVAEPTPYLIRDTNYNSFNSTYAWDDSGSYDQIASSANFGGNFTIDYILGVLKFSAVASPTTPSGLYTVSANFVATATF